MNGAGMRSESRKKERSTSVAPCHVMVFVLVESLLPWQLSSVTSSRATALPGFSNTMPPSFYRSTCSSGCLLFLVLGLCYSLLGSLKSVCTSVNSLFIKLSSITCFVRTSRALTETSRKLLSPNTTVSLVPPNCLRLLRTHYGRRNLWSEKITSRRNKITHLPVTFVPSTLCCFVRSTWLFI